MTIVRLDEAGLAKAGISQQTILALRHLLRQVGDRVGETTLPDAASGLDVLNPIIAAMQLADAALRVRASDLEAEDTNLPVPDNALLRRLDDLAAEVQEQRITADSLARQVADLSAELQETRLTNSALERRIADLENGVN